MRRSGVTDYATFAKEVLGEVTDHPISFEVVADEFEEMRRQARLISSWGDNVFVKIPVTNTRGESSADLIRELSLEGLKLNVTAILRCDRSGRLFRHWRTAQPLFSPSSPAVSQIRVETRCRS